MALLTPNASSWEIFLQGVYKALKFFRGKINSSKTFGGCFILLHSFSQGAASHGKFLAFRDVIADVLIGTFAHVKIGWRLWLELLQPLSRSFNKGIEIMGWFAPPNRLQGAILVSTSKTATERTTHDYFSPQYRYWQEQFSSFR